MCMSLGTLISNLRSDLTSEVPRPLVYRATALLLPLKYEKILECRNQKWLYRLSTLTQSGLRDAVAFDFGSKVVLRGVLGVATSAYALATATRAAFTTKKANLGARQPLGPWPKARKV